MINIVKRLPFLGDFTIKLGLMKYQITSQTKIPIIPGSVLSLLLFSFGGGEELSPHSLDMKWIQECAHLLNEQLEHLSYIYTPVVITTSQIKAQNISCTPAGSLGPLSGVTPPTQ